MRNWLRTALDPAEWYREGIVLGCVVVIGIPVSLVVEKSLWPEASSWVLTGIAILVGSLIGELVLRIAARNQTDQD